MSRIKDRLKQYKDKYSDCYKYAGLYVKSVLDMLEQLQGDLEQDEKENGWVPVSERLPEPGNDVAVLLKGFIPAIGRYEVRRDSIGTFVVPGQIETPVEFRLPVTAWTPLPEPCKED